MHLPPKPSNDWRESHFGKLPNGPAKPPPRRWLRMLVLLGVIAVLGAAAFLGWDNRQLIREQINSARAASSEKVAQARTGFDKAGLDARYVEVTNDFDGGDRSVVADLEAPAGEESTQQDAGSIDVMERGVEAPSVVPEKAGPSAIPLNIQRALSANDAAQVKSLSIIRTRREQLTEVYDRRLLEKAQRRAESNTYADRAALQNLQANIANAVTQIISEVKLLRLLEKRWAEIAQPYALSARAPAVFGPIDSRGGIESGGPDGVARWTSKPRIREASSQSGKGRRAQNFDPFAGGSP